MIIKRSFPPRLFHRPRPPTPCHPPPAGVRARACPFLPAPPRAAPEHAASRWPTLSAAGRPGSAGQDGFLEMGSGLSRAARGRTAGCGRERPRLGIRLQAMQPLPYHAGLTAALAFPIARSSEYCDQDGEPSL